MSSSRNTQPVTDSSVSADGARTGELPITRDDRGSIEDQIRMRAYELYCERGSKPGDEVQDWLRAEREYSSQRRLVTEDGGNRMVSHRSSVERN